MPAVTLTDGTAATLWAIALFRGCLHHLVLFHEHATSFIHLAEEVRDHLLCQPKGGERMPKTLINLYHCCWPATCLTVTFTRLKRLVMAIMRMMAASPFSS